MRAKRWRGALVLAIVGSGTPLACSLLDPLGDIPTGGMRPDASDPLPPADLPEARVEAGLDAGTDEACDVSDYDGGPVTEGFLCGVGSCRKRLTGPSCRIVVHADGGKVSPCATAFPDEELGNGVDDNCDGVVDEGLTSVEPDAGFRCDQCGYGKAVQRLADGTLLTAGGVENRKAHLNWTGCINSTLCSLGTAQWIRNVSMKYTCTEFCQSMGGECRPACSTSSAVCNAPAIGTNLGTYSHDWRCTVPQGHPNGHVGEPLVGGCETKFLGFVDPSSDFNLFCCCAF